MKKYVALVASLFLISLTGVVLAQEETTSIAPEETITISDLGVQDAGILPTSPFYFFKEMGRSIQSFATFNSVSKAELELKFANEKAAELKKISETQPQNTKAIQKALNNYQATQEKLRARFEGLKETSQNPRIDTLLNNFTEKAVKHEKLLDEISLKFNEREGIAESVKNAAVKSQNIIREALKKDDPAKFSSRLEKVLLEEKGGDLKHARSVEIIDRFSNNANGEARESLEKLRAEFSEKLEADIKNLVEEKGEEALNEKIIKTPGDFAKRSVIIEEIQRRSGEHLSETLGKAINRVEVLMEKDADLSQKAKEQIERAEEMIQEAERKISEPANTKASQAISTLLAEAKEHLKNAKSAFDGKKYGEALGQARSAEVLARNALKFFEREKPAATTTEIKPAQQAPLAKNRCEEITKNIVELKALLAAKKITEADFKIKYDNHIRQLIICQGAKNTLTPTAQPSVGNTGTGTVKPIEPIRIQTQTNQ